MTYQSTVELLASLVAYNSRYFYPEISSVTELRWAEKQSLPLTVLMFMGPFNQENFDCQDPRLTFVLMIPSLKANITILMSNTFIFDTTHTLPKLQLPLHSSGPSSSWALTPSILLSPRTGARNPLREMC